MIPTRYHWASALQFSCRASAEEHRRSLPGDSRVSTAVAAWTHGITIAAPPSSVWPWLAQLGADRGGWYSFDFIDNGGRPSATRILPEHQQVVVGQVVPALPGATDAFVVADVVPESTLLLTVVGPDATVIVSWVFFLEQVHNSDTRLLVRARVSAEWRDLARDPRDGDQVLLIHRIYRLLASLPPSLMIWLGGVGHGVMERRMLQGIKRRAEGRS